MKGYALEKLLPKRSQPMISRLRCFFGFHSWFVISGDNGMGFVQGIMKCLICKTKRVVQMDGRGITITKLKEPAKKQDV